MNAVDTRLKPETGLDPIPVDFVSRGEVAIGDVVKHEQT
jgi:hypothetical protein